MPANVSNLLSTLTSSLMAPIEQGLEKKHKQEQALKDEERQIQASQFTRILSDPGVSQEYKNKAAKDLQKLYHPEAKKAHGKVVQMLGSILKPLSGAGMSSPSQSQGLSQPSFSDVAGAYGSSYQTPKDAITQRRETSVKKLEDARARGVSAEELDRMEAEDEYIETGKWPVKKGVAQGTLKQVGYKLPDGTIWHGAMDPKAKPGSQFFNQDGSPFSVPNDAEPLPNPANVRPIQVASDALTKKQMMEEAQARGQVYYDENLQPINLRELPDDPNIVMQATTIQAGGGKFRKVYTARNINDNVYTIGGMKVALSPTALPETGEPIAGTSNARALGVAQAGSVGTREQIGIDPTTGKAVATTLETTRRPNTPGLLGSPQFRNEPRLSSPQGLTPQGSPRSETTPQRRGGTRELGNFMPTGPAMTQEKQMAGMRGLVTTAFGDPDFPNLKSLADYSYLADSPNSRKKIASAADLIRSVAFEGPDGNESGLKAGGIHISSGSLGDFAAYSLKIPKAVAGAKTGLIQDAVTKLSPDEKSALNVLLTMYADISAIRGLTGQAATESAARTAQTEMANFMTSSSKQDFQNMLSRTAALVNEGTAFNQFMKPQMRERLNQIMGGKAPKEETKGPDTLTKPGEADIIKKLDATFGR